MLWVLKLNKPQMNLPMNNKAIVFVFGAIIYNKFPIIKPIQDISKGFFVDFLKRKVSYK